MKEEATLLKTLAEAKQKCRLLEKRLAELRGEQYVEEEDKDIQVGMPVQREEEEEEREEREEVEGSERKGEGEATPSNGDVASERRRNSDLRSETPGSLDIICFISLGTKIV